MQTPVSRRIHPKELNRTRTAPPLPGRPESAPRPPTGSRSTGKTWRRQAARRLPPRHGAAAPTAAARLR
eukprot:4450213-Prymnesium_polylepis.1